MAFPVDIKSTIKDYAIKEGTFAGMEMSSSSIVAQVASAVTVGGVVLSPTEIFYAEEAVMAVTGGAALAHLQYYSGINNTSVGETNHRIPLKDNAVSLQLNTIFLPKTNTTFLLRNGDGTTPLMASCNISGYRMTADLNFNANKVILWIGDSIGRGSSLNGNNFSNVTDFTALTPDDHYAFKVRNSLNLDGYDSRLVIKAMGSYTSRMMGVYLKQGGLDIDQADLIFYQLGVNDATGTTTDPQYSAELDAVIQWKKRKFPKSILVFLGATPLNNNTNETRNEQLRVIMQSKVSLTNKIFYHALTTTIDRTNLASYAANDGVHPATTQQTNIALSIYNNVKTII